MEFGFIMFMSVIIVLVGTFGICYLEPEKFPSLFDGFWWTMTTVTTVGYGDYYPTTILGRLLGIFLFIFGIGIIGVLISKTVDSITTYNKLKTEGMLMYKNKEHYIYIGYSAKTENAIREVLVHNPEAEIVLIDTLPNCPYMHNQVHYIQGDPSEEEILLKANILESKRVAIFADSSITDPILADGKTLLIASAVESLSEQTENEIHTIVEICEESHISKFRHIRVDDFVLSNDSVSLLIAKATLQPGTTQLFRQLLSKRYGNNIHVLKPSSQWSTYRDAHLALFDKGAVLIAINDEMDFKDAKSKKLKSTDTLYIVCSDEIYSTL
ncbi:potassium channel protein [Falsibacillus albus]|uniref:Potassium channel protein n=2 Tax=Falsibacillus albus TaxID=2478915 RepID=A0A3L7JVF2_9BACI|nr:potassium channel protein [Falsibacillus albus]